MSNSAARRRFRRRLARANLVAVRSMMSASDVYVTRSDMNIHASFVYDTCLHPLNVVVAVNAACPRCGRVRAQLPDDGDRLRGVWAPFDGLDVLDDIISGKDGGS